MLAPLCLAIALSFLPAPGGNFSNPDWGRILKGLAAGSAAGAASEQYRKLEELEQKRVQQVAKVDEIAERVRAAGLDPDEYGLYSVRMKVDVNASKVWWADTFNRADVFFTVTFEGQPEVLVPLYRADYNGEEIFAHFLCHRPHKGDRILVQVWDDDSSSNAIWNNILQTSVAVDINPKIQAKLGPVSVSGSLVSGKATFQLLKDGQKVVLDAQDFLGQTEFQLTEDWRQWTAEGKLTDVAGNQIGVVALRQMWTPLDRAKAELATTKSEASTSRLWMWILGGGAVALIISMFKDKPTAKG